MTKKDVVALAEVLRMYNQTADARTEFTPDHLSVLADFCAAQYPNFNRERWIDYIAGLNRYESSPKRGPRLTANRQQQEALQSLLRQLRMEAGPGRKTYRELLVSPKRLSAIMSVARGDWICWNSVTSARYLAFL